jgi:hypothetical protein
MEGNMNLVWALLIGFVFSFFTAGISWIVVGVIFFCFYLEDYLADSEDRVVRRVKRELGIDKDDEDDFRDDW